MEGGGWVGPAFLTARSSQALHLLLTLPPPAFLRQSPGCPATLPTSQSNPTVCP